MENKKRKINIADIIILLVLAVGIIILIHLFFGSDSGFLKGEQNVLSYTIKLENVPVEYAGNIRVDDTVCDDKSGSVIGKITDVAYNKSSKSVYDKDARYYKQYTYPDKQDITVTLSTTASFSDGRYITDGFVIAAGKKVKFRVPELIFDGQIISAQKIETSASSIIPESIPGSSDNQGISISGGEQ